MPVNYFDIENGVAGFTQKDYRLKRHRHFPIEAAFILSGRLDISTPNHQHTNIQSVIINANVAHTFSCLNGECQLYFIDPTSHAGRHITKHYFSGGEEVIVPKEMDAGQFREKYLTETKQSKGSEGIDERIQYCLNWIQTNYTLEGIRLSQLSKIAFLSESRLAHLFKAEIGIPVHQYILWKKIQMAIKQYQEGASLTDCAYSSGFADVSHFNKTFKKMFGIYPSFANKI